MFEGLRKITDEAQKRAGEIAADPVGKIVDGVQDRVERLVKDPVGETVRGVTQPVRDGLEVIDGFTAGELRAEAALRLGADVASSMALSQLIAWHQSE